MENQVIACPKCGTEIDVNAVLYQNINKELEQKYIEKNNLSQKEYEQKLADLKKSEESFKKQAEELDSKINAGVSAQLKTEKAKIEQNVRKQLQDETSGELKSLQDELKRKSDQLKEFNQAKADIERLKREKDEIVSEITLAKEKEFNDKLKQERDKISKQYQDDNQLKEENLRKKLTEENSGELKMLKDDLARKSEQVKELNQTKADIEKLKREKDEMASEMNLAKEKEINEILKIEKEKLSKQYQDENYLKIEEYRKTIDDLTKQIADVKRQAEQGSVQMQGEIQELVIENELKSIYPLDTIEEIKKGQSGADILQTVFSNSGHCCGKIYYESKRTKEFNQNWIKKLKDDNLQINADALVIITETLPDNNIFSFRDGVYIVSFREFKAISVFIRNFLLRMAENNVANANKGTKEALLYAYLTSNEFKAQFEAIVGNFKDLKDSLYKEKLRSEKVFRERDKQIDSILTNMAGFHGSIKGIAGAQVADVMLLEDEKTELIEE
ncbi:MAG: DUF2130 domain-containing protein [bacterium]